MPTTYNIKLVAVHPLNLGFVTPDHASNVMRDLEKFCQDHGMVAVGAQVERNDDAKDLEYESRAWAHNAPEALITAIGKMLDGFRAQMLDPESDLFDRELADEEMTPGCGPAYISFTDLAERLVAYRREVTKS